MTSLAFRRRRSRRIRPYLIAVEHVRAEDARAFLAFRTLAGLRALRAEEVAA